MCSTLAVFESDEIGCCIEKVSDLLEDEWASALRALANCETGWELPSSMAWVITWKTYYDALKAWEDFDTIIQDVRGGFDSYRDYLTRNVHGLETNLLKSVLAMAILGFDTALSLKSDLRQDRVLRVTLDNRDEIKDTLLNTFITRAVIAHDVTRMARNPFKRCWGLRQVLLEDPSSLELIQEALSNPHIDFGSTIK